MNRETEWIGLLSSDSRPDRFSALREIEAEGIGMKFAFPEVNLDDVNNHIHSRYSFSPYTPSMCAFLARKAGLAIVGLIDHDSIAGAEEIRQASTLFQIPATVGFEIRAGIRDSPLANQKINNPDSKGIIYCVVHGVPPGAEQQVHQFLEPIRNSRFQRNLHQIDSLNQILEDIDLEPLDRREIIASSFWQDGGSITERHILFTLAEKTIRTAGIGGALVNYLTQKAGVRLSEDQKRLLSDSKNPYLSYDLLGVLKAAFLDRFFIQPDENECVSAIELVRFCNAIGAVAAYGYLGDVTDSPTGDKKPEKYEDEILTPLFDYLKQSGFHAITYMPSRNSEAQLIKIRQMCRQYEFMEISGVDINSPRQSFNCPEILSPDFSHLTDASYALIGHEFLAAGNPEQALFHPDNPFQKDSLEARLKHYAEQGRIVSRRIRQP